MRTVDLHRGSRFAVFLAGAPARNAPCAEPFEVTDLQSRRDIYSPHFRWGRATPHCPFREKSRPSGASVDSMDHLPPSVPPTSRRLAEASRRHHTRALGVLQSVQRSFKALRATVSTYESSASASSLVYLRPCPNNIRPYLPSAFPVSSIAVSGGPARRVPLRTRIQASSRGSRPSQSVTSPWTVDGSRPSSASLSVFGNAKAISIRIDSVRATPREETLDYGYPTLSYLSYISPSPQSSWFERFAHNNCR